MKRSFYTVDGVIVGESTGSSVINYATDALGSVTGTLVNGQLQNTYAYKPYGALLAKTGNGDDPKQGWNGTSGYRPTGMAQSDYYVRTRHFGVSPGRWSATDPLWPVARAYAYARCAPAVRTDWLGLGSSGTHGPGRVPTLPGTITCDPTTNEAIYEYCYWCRDMNGVAENPDCVAICDQAAWQYYQDCYNKHKGNKPKHTPTPGEHWTYQPGAGIAPEHFSTCCTKPNTPGYHFPPFSDIGFPGGCQVYEREHTMKQCLQPYNNAECYACCETFFLNGAGGPSGSIDTYYSLCIADCDKGEEQYGGGLMGEPNAPHTPGGGAGGGGSADGGTPE